MKNSSTRFIFQRVPFGVQKHVMIKTDVLQNHIILLPFMSEYFFKHETLKRIEIFLISIGPKSLNQPTNDLLMLDFVYFDVSVTFSSVGRHYYQYWVPGPPFFLSPSPQPLFYYHSTHYSDKKPSTSYNFTFSYVHFWILFTFYSSSILNRLASPELQYDCFLVERFDTLPVKSFWIVSLYQLIGCIMASLT